MQGIANLVAAHGRGEDTTLVHMTPKEVEALQGIAQLHGGSLTVNPHTGLPEAGFLSKILPTLAGAATTYFTGSPWGAALAGGATSAIQGRNPLMGALQGYGGGAMAGALGAGTAATSAGEVFGPAMENGAMGTTGFGNVMGPAMESGEMGTTGVGSMGETAAYPMDMGIPYESLDSPFTNPPWEAASFNAADSTGIASPYTSANYANPVPDAPASVNPAVSPRVAESIAPSPTQTNSFIDKIMNKAKNTDWLNMDTYYNEKLGRPTGLGYAGLGLGALGMNMMGTRAANKASRNRWDRYSVLSPTGAYQSTAAWRPGMAAGGIASAYPNRAPEREVLTEPDQVGVEPSVDPFTGQMAGMAGGGQPGHPRFLKGPGDGMSDSIPAHIGGKQPAALANEEFVIPADVVSHLGNGSSEAGAKQLYAMMDRIRKARTGNPKQGKQINPRKLMVA